MSKVNSDLLWRSSLRFLLSHPWHFVLSILGVALGVAVVVSIDISNSSAQKAFELSTEAVTGNVTHQITGTGNTIPDSLYRVIRIEQNLRNSAPVIEGYARIKGMNRTFQLLGVDPIAETPFRAFASQKAGINLAEYMSGANTGLISKQVGEALSIEIGNWIPIIVQGKQYRLKISGYIEADDTRSRQALESMVIVDISTAQRLLNMEGKLSHIDLILPSDSIPKITKAISTILPKGTSLVRSKIRTQTVEQMTRAFEFNLQALSMLALLVGMFLIYNTMTFSVVQRRPVIGRLRALGVQKSEILALILKEALLIGALGTIVGLVTGILLAQILVKLVTQSINDLYFVLNVQALRIGFLPLFKGTVLGMGATLAAAWWPAREASRQKITIVLKRSSSESGMASRLGVVSTSGLLLVLIGGLILFIPNGGILAGYTSLLFLIVGFSLVVPIMIIGMAMVLRPTLAFLTGLIGKMAIRGVVTELSRTSVAIAALAVAVAATVGVGVMVDSFRTTVVSWLESQLQADIYVQPPSAVSRNADATLDSTLVIKLVNTHGIAETGTVRSVEISTNNGMDHLVAISQNRKGTQAYQFKKSTKNFWPRFREKSVVMVSEVYAYHNKMVLGDTLYIQTDRGNQPFTIAAINLDYASDIGTVTMSRNVYNYFFEDRGISGLALYAENEVDVDALVHRLRARAKGMQQVFIRSNKGLREASIEIFDRTFTVTTILRMLAILVAFMGVLSALMALQFERAKELAVLRANGMTPMQLWNYVITQTGVMGLMAAVLSVPLGVLMAYILVYVINVRSFGWTLQFMISGEILLQAMALAIVAAILAGIYPSWKMAQANASEALRNE